MIDVRSQSPLAFRASASRSIWASAVPTNVVVDGTATKAVADRVDLRQVDEREGGPLLLAVDGDSVDLRDDLVHDDRVVLGVAGDRIRRHVVAVLVVLGRVVARCPDRVCGALALVGDVEDPARASACP